MQSTPKAAKLKGAPCQLVGRVNPFIMLIAHTLSSTSNKGINFERTSANYASKTSVAHLFDEPLAASTV